MPSPLRSGVLGLAVLLSIGLTLACAMMVRVTVRTLTRPPRRTYSWAVARGKPGDPGELPVTRSFREWSFASRGHSFPAWDIMGDDPAGPLVVVTHGWGDSRVTMLDRADALCRLSSRVVVWDLPGQGDAPGLCSLGVREPEDLSALLAALPAGEPVVLYGFSLGAGVSIVAARAVSGAGLVGVIAEAPYRVPATPARAVLHQTGMPYRWNLPCALWWIGLRLRGGLAAASFDRCEHAALVAVPLLVIHTEEDEICPIQDGESIAAAAPKGLMLRVVGGDHLGLWTNPTTSPIVAEACGKFLRQFQRSCPT